MAKVEISGLQCDKPDCNYVDPTIKVEDYKDYINFPCPVCGSSLLTQFDYDQVQLVLRMAETLPHDPNDKTQCSIILSGDDSVKTRCGNGPTMTIKEGVAK